MRSTFRRWFTETFLDFREDVADAAKDGRRLIVYFGQDGCPYCRQLMVTNFSQRAIVDKTRRHFVAIALNIWGDRETTWLDGRTRTEKALARHLDVQFTPTLLFLDEKGNIVARLNGYWPPHKFEAALDYVAGAAGEARAARRRISPASRRRPARASLADEPFFLPPPYDLARKPGSRPLAVVFETPYCAACDEMHRDTLRRPDVQAALRQFDVARFGLGARTDLTAPDGGKVKADAWARDLRVSYTPTIVLLRREAGARCSASTPTCARSMSPRHSSTSRAARTASEPSFQRFVQARAERLRMKGEIVDLWQ